MKEMLTPRSPPQKKFITVKLTKRNKYSVFKYKKVGFRGSRSFQAEDSCGCFFTTSENNCLVFKDIYIYIYVHVETTTQSGFQRYIRNATWHE